MELQQWHKLFLPIVRNKEGTNFVEKYLWETIEDFKELQNKPVANIWTLVCTEEHDFSLISGGEIGEDKMGWILCENPNFNPRIIVEI